MTKSLDDVVGSLRPQFHAMAKKRSAEFAQQLEKRVDKALRRYACGKLTMEEARIEILHIIHDAKRSAWDVFDSLKDIYESHKRRSARTISEINIYLEDYDRAVRKLEKYWYEDRMELEALRKKIQRQRGAIRNFREADLEEVKILAASARRFKTGLKKGQINYRAFERTVLKEKFPAGINGRRFLGDGNFASDLLRKLKMR